MSLPSLTSSVPLTLVVACADQEIISSYLDLGYQILQDSIVFDRYGTMKREVKMTKFFEDPSYKFLNLNFRNLKLAST